MSRMRAVAIGIIVSSAFVYAALVIAQTPIPNAQKRSETHKTVHDLFVEDGQAGHQVNSDAAEREYYRGLEVRMSTLRSMLATGEFRSAEDFKEAAFVFQHGNNPEDCLFAHVLALEALMRGDESAKWIAASTLDRYLQSIKQPQVFGTQYPLNPNLAHTAHAAAAGQAPFRGGRTLEPYNENFLPDSVRLDFCVPVLTQQKQNVSLFNAGQNPRRTMTASGCSR
jgi:hypothetical protein